MRLLLTYRSLFVIALTASMTLTPDSVRAARKPGKTLTAAALGVLGLEVSIPSPRTGSDSTKIIQNAVDQVAAAGGGVVHLPKGTYLLNSYRKSTHPWKFYNLLVPSNVTLKGDPGAVLQQGPSGQAPLPERAAYVENDVVAVGTLAYQKVTFQSPSFNGGFMNAAPTNAKDTFVTLTDPKLSSRFSAGDFIGVYSRTFGDVINSEVTQVISVDRASGKLELSFPLARSFSVAHIANVTPLITRHVALENLTIQGSVPLVVTEVFDFTASNCHFVYAGSTEAGRTATGMIANTVRKFSIVDSSFEPSVGSNYAPLELPQRNSQDVLFRNVTFAATQIAFGEYAAHWILQGNHFWIYPGNNVAVGLVTGGLDVEFGSNDIHGTIVAGSGSGALIADYAGPTGESSQFGRIIYRANKIECRADGNNCMRLSTKDPLVTGNSITTTGSANGIKVEGLQGQVAMIRNNTISVGTSPAIVLNSTMADGSVISDNTLTGTGAYAVYVANSPSPQLGGHVFSNNRISGFQNAVFLNVTLHPGTVIQKFSER